MVSVGRQGKRSTPEYAQGDGCEIFSSAGERISARSTYRRRVERNANRRGITATAQNTTEFWSHMPELAVEFERAMYEQVYQRVYRECGYRAERFRQMVCPPRPGQRSKL